MDEFTQKLIEGIIDDVAIHNQRIDEYFDEYIRYSEEDFADETDLQAFKSIHKSVVQFLDSKIEEFKGMELMGMDLLEDEKSEEDEELLNKYAESMYVMNEKVSIILQFFVDSLGEELVVEVLELE